MRILMIAKTYLGRGQARTNMYAIKGYMNEPDLEDWEIDIFDWTQERRMGDFRVARAIIDGGYWCPEDDAVYTYSFDELEVVQ